MKSTALAAILALACAAPAFAQDEKPADGTAAAAPAAAAPAATPAKLSVETSTVADIIANPAAKAALEKELPDIPAYYDQIGAMTLTQIAPMSDGRIDDAKLKAIQADFDAIK